METLSKEELEAERLYYALVSWSLCKRAFVILAKDLAARSEVAGAYLCWLILRGQEWPTVGRGAEGPKFRQPRILLLQSV
jgi:hypothetical protein